MPCSRWIGCLVFVLLAAPLPGTSPVGDRLAPLADRLAEYLQKHGHPSVALGNFTAPATLGNFAGPGVQRALADELTSRKIRLDARAGITVRGSYQPRGNRDRPDGVRVTVEVVRANKVLDTFTEDVLFADEKSKEPDGARAIAPLLGLTADLPPDLNVKRRLQKAQDGTAKPHVHVDSTRISSSTRSPYLVEIVVAGKALEPTVRGGRAQVELKRGDLYAIRLTNDSDQPTAVTLTIDGLGLFAFSSDKAYGHVIVPGKQKVLIRGWYRNAREVEAFEVTSYGKSAAASLLPGTPRIGCITATFAACWAKDTRPPEEERFANLTVSRGERLATGRGPLLAETSKEVEMHIGAVRSAVSVRYLRPEP